MRNLKLFSKIFLYIPSGLLFTYFEPANLLTSSSDSAKSNSNFPKLNVQLQTIPPFFIKARSIAAATPPDEERMRMQLSCAHPCFQ